MKHMVAIPFLKIRRVITFCLIINGIIQHKFCLHFGNKYNYNSSAAQSAYILKLIILFESYSVGRFVEIWAAVCIFR